MTYRELIEALQGMPDHWLDETAKVAVPVMFSDDFDIEADVVEVERCSVVYIRTEPVMPKEA